MREGYFTCDRCGLLVTEEEAVLDPDGQIVCPSSDGGEDWEEDWEDEDWEDWESDKR
jgi:hypothetical protein